MLYAACALHAAADPLSDLDRPSLKRSSAAGTGGPALADGNILDQAERTRSQRVAETKRRASAERTCTEAAQAHESCVAASQQTCSAEPEVEACLETKTGTTKCRPGVGSCYIFPTYECVRYGPNPLHEKWKQCAAEKASSKANSCSSAPPVDVQKCVTQTLTKGSVPQPQEKNPQLKLQARDLLAELSGSTKKVKSQDESAAPRLYPQEPVSDGKSKLHPFTRTERYTSGYRTIGEARARASLSERREELEPQLLGLASSWKVTGSTTPACKPIGIAKKRENLPPEEYWQCTMSVTYTGMSAFAGPSSGKSGGATSK